MARRHGAIIRITSGYDSYSPRRSITRLEMIDVQAALAAHLGDSCDGDDVPARPPPRPCLCTGIAATRHDLDKLDRKGRVAKRGSLIEKGCGCDLFHRFIRAAV